MKPNIINKDSIRSGDILLCYSKELHGMDASIKNGYSHVAICTNESLILESSANGVSFTNIDNLLEDYGHMAVLRSNEVWSEGRLSSLMDFSNKNIGKKFNRIGMGKYEERKEKHQDTAMERIHGYFEGTIAPSPSDREVYFCSELITSAFIHVGIIEKSASVIFAPETFSPEDIGRDKLFGFFIGYIISYAEYKIPENDMFENSV